MPIITTPGQQPPVAPPKNVPAAPPSRIQSVFSPTTTASQTPPPPPAVDDTDDDTDLTLPLDNDMDTDDESDDFMPPMQGNSNGKQDLSLSRMSEEQRRTTITDAFQLVLGKDPTDRDFSYYRFSTLTMEGLMKSLLNLPEHKKLLEKAHEHTGLKQSVSDLDLQVKQLNESMLSMKQELITMQQLLMEKNRYIQQMRGMPDENQPYVSPVMQTPTPVQQPVIQQPTPVAQSESSVDQSVQIKKLPGPFDELKSMFKGLFGGGQ